VRFLRQLRFLLGWAPGMRKAEAKTISGGGTRPSSLEAQYPAAGFKDELVDPLPDQWPQRSTAATSDELSVARGFLCRGCHYEALMLVPSSIGLAARRLVTSAGPARLRDSNARRSVAIGSE
jgi:hypothetical protein